MPSAHAIILEQPERLSVRPVELNAPGADDVVVDQVAGGDGDVPVGAAVADDTGTASPSCWASRASWRIPMARSPMSITSPQAMPRSGLAVSILVVSFRT